MKNYQVLFLKILIGMAIIPVLFLVLYKFPSLFIEGFSSGSEYVPYLFGSMISVCIMSVPYAISLVHTFKLLILLEKKEFVSQNSEKSLTIIKKMAFIVAIIFLVDMPFIYIIADMDDAPGLIMIGLFLMIFALAIGVFANLIKKFISEQRSEKSINNG
ncbi:MAG: DUF2975 domain-containing protein [Candidatus Izemoplasmatales bacterium]|nr:DUF2975 domain-containing protein [Candidatus Izemoplasmatales bacterium]